MSKEQKSAAELAAETKAAFDKKFDAVKEIAENALGKAEAGEAISADLKTKADEALTEMNGIKAQLDELTQKLDRSGDLGADEQKSVGERFV